MSRFELSEQTSSLVRYLQALEKNTEITYRELSEAVSFRVGPTTGRLIYARKILQRDHNAVWTCVRPRVGLRRLNDAEIAERLPTWWYNGARNKLTRGSDQADVVDIAKLDIDQQARFAVDSIQGQLAREALSKATRKRVEKTARGTSNDLPSFTVVGVGYFSEPER